MLSKVEGYNYKIINRPNIRPRIEINYLSGSIHFRLFGTLSLIRSIINDLEKLD